MGVLSRGLSEDGGQELEDVSSQIVEDEDMDRYTLTNFVTQSPVICKSADCETSRSRYIFKKGNHDFFMIWGDKIRPLTKRERSYPEETF